MCTFNISIDDELAAKARAGFEGEKAFVEWMRNCIQTMLHERLALNEADGKATKQEALDSLMGILGPDTGVDYRKMYYEDKYGHETSC